LAFINKMDRTGANPESVTKQVREKLGADAVLMQIPVGREDEFNGVVDLITMKAFYFDGSNGEKIRTEEIPAELKDEAAAARTHMLESLSMYSDELMELLLGEEEVPEKLIHKIVREATINQGFTPVYLGSAYKNKGVQLLMDAVTRYLPSPLDRNFTALNPKNPEEKVKLESDPNKPFVGMAFKIMDDEFGQLTFTRVYQGTVKKGEMYFNQRTGKKDRFSRIVKMHADRREDIDAGEAGDIVAIMGLDCASGDTYAAEPNYCTLESMYVAEPVIKMSINPITRDGADRLSKALQRFRKEDPTFNVYTDEETSETVIAGMGELHLEIYVERIRREYRVEVEVGAPKVSYREAPTIPYSFNHTRKKQTGGSGQYGCIIGTMGPLTDEDRAEHPEAGEFLFLDKVIQGRIPKNFIPAIEKGVKNMTVKGPLAGFPVVNFKFELTDGKYHDVDSSDMAFMLTAQELMREEFGRMKPALLEPIMLVEIECPESFQGAVVGNISSRRGIVTSTEMIGKTAKIIAEIPLAETFGYSTDLRSMTQGQGTFTMELHRYRPVPSNIQTEIIAERKAELQPA
jgi:elongation factor G